MHDYGEYVPGQGGQPAREVEPFWSPDDITADRGEAASAQSTTPEQGVPSWQSAPVTLAHTPAPPVATTPTPHADPETSGHADPVASRHTAATEAGTHSATTASVPQPRTPQYETWSTSAGHSAQSEAAHSGATAQPTVHSQPVAHQQTGAPQQTTPQQPYQQAAAPQQPHEHATTHTPQHATAQQQTSPTTQQQAPTTQQQAATTQQQTAAFAPWQQAPQSGTAHHPVARGQARPPTVTDPVQAPPAVGEEAAHATAAQTGAAQQQTAPHRESPAPGPSRPSTPGPVSPISPSPGPVNPMPAPGPSHPGPQHPGPTHPHQPQPGPTQAARGGAETAPHPWPPTHTPPQPPNTGYPSVPLSYAGPSVHQAPPHTARPTYTDQPWTPEPYIPTAEEFARRRAARPAEPVATMGVRAMVNKGTFGLVKLPPSRHEQEIKRDIEMVRRNFGGLRQVTIVNPKGGAGKTVATLLLAMTFGQKRGGYVLAWDNNETQGTLGMRAQQDFHSRTVRDLLRDLHQFQGAHGRIGDLSQYVRAQGEGMFDVLASDESATAGEMLTAAAFAEIREVVSRFYKLIFVDTGNNVRAENWQAAIDATDQLVVTMSARNDSAETAARMLDHLEQTGRQRLVRQAVTIVSMPPSRRDIDLPPIQQHFAARTRAVLLAPYERLLDTGEPIQYGQLSSNTKDAWLKIAAAVAEGL